MINIETFPFPEYYNGKINRRQCSMINLTNTNIYEEIDYIHNSGVDFVNVSPSKGFRKGNLDALLRTDNFWGLIIFAGKNIDISAVEKCTHIKFLSITDTPQVVDISNHSEIEVLNTQWRKDVILPQPNTSKLKDWTLWHYPETTLEQLPTYPYLTVLEINWGSVNSLQGLEKYPKLKCYEHHYGKNLVNISSLVKLKQLEYLLFDHCKKIDVNSIFEHCKKLKSLKYFDCPPLSSLSFLQKMKCLESFRFGGTEIQDGNVTPLLKLKDFGFYPNKRHYSHTCEELERMHGELQSKESAKQAEK